MLIVANFKMELTYEQTIEWLNNYQHKLIQATLIICPTAVALPFFKAKSQLIYGAQQCSDHERGAYTGQLSVLSLKELGCSYCIIGHSESRLYCNETDEKIAMKASLLLEHSIIPIICIGETLDERNNNLSYQVIEAQLQSLNHVFKRYHQKKSIIAYEPRWAIGTGKVPSLDEINKVIEFIKDYLNKSVGIQSTVLYGGSVTPETIGKLKKLSYNDGFLIGKASTDYKNLSAILQELK